MIVIPPEDPNERRPDPAEEALGQLYEQFTNVQNLAEFHGALRRRDALYELQHQEIADSPQDYENLHPKDFFNQFHRRADEDDKTILSEAPYRIRQQLRDVLAPERDTALDRAKETYKKLFIDRQLAQLDQDRLYYLGKIADAASDQDRERYLTALIGRLKLSGDVGLLYKEDADRLIENIPSDLDIFSFNREYASDRAQAQRLLLYGAYPNMRPELREELVKTAKTYDGQADASDTTASELLNPVEPVDAGNSEPNKYDDEPSKDQTAIEPNGKEDTTEGDGDSQAQEEQYAAASGRPPTAPHASQSGCVGIIGPVPGYPETGRDNWRACNDQKFIDAAGSHNTFYGLKPGSPGYVTPQLLKAWAMVESGGDMFKASFLSDPFQVNKPADWVSDKEKLGLRKGEKMTPEKSAEAALEWMREKSFLNNGGGGLAAGLSNYNGSSDDHRKPDRLKYGDDYHPGVPHYEWYANKVLRLESEMLKSQQR
jgi:hypothetical protein